MESVYINSFCAWTFIKVYFQKQNYASISDTKYLHLYYSITVMLVREFLFAQQKLETYSETMNFLFPFIKDAQPNLFGRECCIYSREFGSTFSGGSTYIYKLLLQCGNFCFTRN